MLELLIGAGFGAFVGGLFALTQFLITRRDNKKKSNKEVLDKLADMDKKLDAYIDKNEQDKADSSRFKILRFTDEVKNGVKHTEEHWNEILATIDKYKRFSSNHPNYPNNKAVKSIEFLESVYSDILKKNDFI